MSVVKLVEAFDEKAEYIKKHFPEIDHGFEPCATKILVQFRTMERFTAGGIELPPDTVQFNKESTRVGRLVACGKLAFRNRDTGQPWFEGVWAEIGDVIIVPAWGGFRFELPIPGTARTETQYDRDDNGRIVKGSERSVIRPGTEDRAIFATFKDHEIEGVIRSNFYFYDRLL